jgi:hypothetical protein
LFLAATFSSNFILDAFKIRRESTLNFSKTKTLRRYFKNNFDKIIKKKLLKPARKKVCPRVSSGNPRKKIVAHGQTRGARAHPQRPRATRPWAKPCKKFKSRCYDAKYAYFHIKSRKNLETPKVFKQTREFFFKAVHQISLSKQKFKISGKEMGKNFEN